jgi:hypothetical protein
MREDHKSWCDACVCLYISLKLKTELAKLKKFPAASVHIVHTSLSLQMTQNIGVSLIKRNLNNVYMATNLKIKYTGSFQVANNIRSL